MTDFVLIGLLLGSFFAGIGAVLGWNWTVNRAVTSRIMAERGQKGRNKQLQQREEVGEAILEFASELAAGKDLKTAGITVVAKHPAILTEIGPLMKQLGI